MSQKCKGIFIVGAKRTPFCNNGGSLRNLPASHIFAIAAKDAIHSANLMPDVIDNTVVGNVHFLSQCDGGKTPRYCGSYSGVPIERAALGVNKACGTGLQAIISGGIDILTGSAKVCLVGGSEQMSSLPHLVRNVRFGASLGGRYEMEDHIKMHLKDSYCDLSMEDIAEFLAKRYGFSKDDVDQYYLRSQFKCKSAQDAKIFDDEITPVMIKTNKEIKIVHDETPQICKNLSSLTATCEGGTVVTSGNSSAPADGAAALILADEKSVNKHGLKPLAKLTGWACVGLDPAEAGLGAVPAIRKLLAVTNKDIRHIDLFEINETFASFAMAVTKELRIAPDRVNVSGGALSIGHPVAATGARMAAHLSHHIRRNNARIAIAASSCGGGQGIAVMMESI